MICLSWFKRRECKADKRVLLETKGREEDLQLLILQHNAVEAWQTMQKTGWSVVLHLLVSPVTKLTAIDDWAHYTDY